MNTDWASVTHVGYHNVPHIEVNVPESVLRELLQRTYEQWAQLSAANPYWTVLTDDANRGQSLEPTVEAALYRSGESALAMLELFEKRNAHQIPRGVCLELGAGVGRLTRCLAQNFERVYAVDISESNLRICERKLRSENITNVEIIHIKRLEDFDLIPSFDLLYSFITLQHNSPPIQYRILDILLKKAARGAFFQTCTNMLNYNFIVEEYHLTDGQSMEMHSLPQWYILELARKYGLQPREVLPDPFAGGYGSSTFFMTK